MHIHTVGPVFLDSGLKYHRCRNNRLCVPVPSGIEVLNWKDYTRTVSWASFFLIGTMMSLGNALKVNGVSEWLVDLLLQQPDRSSPRPACSSDLPDRISPADPDSDPGRL